MSGLPDEEKLKGLLGALADDLAERIKDKTATAADRAVALNLLLKTGTVALVTPGSPQNNVLEALDDAGPFDEEAEIERQQSIFSGPSAGRA